MEVDLEAYHARLKEWSPCDMTLCDGCQSIISVGSIYFQCLECHGWTPPGGVKGKVRQVTSEQGIDIKQGKKTITMASSASDPLVGFDLCASCAQGDIHKEHHLVIQVKTGGKDGL